MKKLVSLTLLVLSFCGQIFAQELPHLKESAFKGGEKLQYKLKYGFLSAATGLLTVTDTKSGNGAPAFRLYATGKTAGAFALYTVKNEYNSYIDGKSYLPYYYTENIREGGYRRNDKVTFDQKTRAVSGNKGDFKSTVSQTFDLLSAYYFARNLDLSSVKAGDSFKLTYFLNDEIATLGIKYIGVETIKTDLGSLECLKFSPEIKPGRIFKKNSKLYLWVTNDGNRIPVKANVDILIGSVTLELIQADGLKHKLGQRASYSK
ncbi:hypothetical protein SF1_31480 [Sphingobacterium faecium NBRC 15299]|jgi:hypothetical protein|uniref:DUF3108 domain-containing protein n=1 Tax=Sphingobacterium faecium TaxID=34087 RepID=UPI000D3CE05E|nr:DUF3108 domain-containing protein [Sphingobacterium faecium]PTX09240.1 uncharacterized protein DUF3108 [Sphingobacterium faecium]GEM65166.1 hypothetical protein SF1_31480 [Sphingobacterium faecium NBRC 15299]